MSTHHDIHEPTADVSESAATRMTQVDILSRIIALSDKLTLAKLSLVNHHCDNIVTPTLFKHVNIDYQNGRHSFDLPASTASQGDAQAIEAARTRNDSTAITERFRRALSFARVLTIHGHAKTDWQAADFIRGLPKQVIEALSGVHTVRIIPIAVPIGNGGFSTKLTEPCLCGETILGDDMCSLLHILQNRSVIISHLSLNDKSSLELVPSFARKVTESSSTPPRPTSFGKAQIVVANTDNLIYFQSRGWFPTPFANVPLTVMVKGSWGNSPAIQTGRTEALLTNAFIMLCQVPEGEIRFACDKMDVERLKKAHTMHTFMRGSSGAWDGKEIERYRERVTFVDREEVMKEKWIEAFKGTDFEDWY